MSKVAKYIEVDAGVEYWEDAIVNGVEDADGSRIPFRDSGRWKLVIDLDEGRVVGWPRGVVADVHYKVCDDGEYHLLDANRLRIGTWEDYYVPDAFLCHGEKGCGDYIIMHIDSDGLIEGWTRPDVNLSEWPVFGRAP